MPNTHMLVTGSVQRRFNLKRPYDVRFMFGSPLELELADWEEISSPIRLMRLEAADRDEAMVKAQGRADAYNAALADDTRRMKILDVLH